MPSSGRRRRVKARLAAEEAATKNQLEALNAGYRRERARLIPAETQRRLAAFSAANPLPSEARHDATARGQRRAVTRAYARELGVDLAAVDRLRTDTVNRFAAIVNPSQSSRSEIRDLPDEPAVPRSQLFTGWNSYWDTGAYYTSRSSSTYWDHDTSYFDAAASRTGAHVRFRLRRTDSNDTAWRYRDNGFMVYYTMPTTAVLRIEMDLIASFGNYFIDTDDEFGVSHCHVHVGEYAIADVYWDWWNDTLPASHSEGAMMYGYSVVSEYWLDTNPFPPGRRRTAILYTNVVFPAGYTVAVFAATRAKPYAWLDDVSVTAGVNAAWYVRDIRVQADSFA